MLGTSKIMIVMPPVICILQAELNMKESQVSDLQKNIKSQQSETSKAKSELKTALEDIEKLKKDFTAERNSWDTQKAALLKREEDVEAALKPVTGELASLKRQINTMTAAIFGKCNVQFKLCNSPGISYMCIANSP